VKRKNAFSLIVLMVAAIATLFLIYKIAFEPAAGPFSQARQRMVEVDLREDPSALIR